MIDTRTVTAIILVAGNSTRYGQNRNKNFEEINGQSVLTYSLKAFNKNDYVDNIIIAVKDEERKQKGLIVEETKIFDIENKEAEELIMSQGLDRDLTVTIVGIAI